MVVNPDPNILKWIAKSVADAAAVNPNGIEMLLANGLITFPIEDNPVFSNGPKSLHKNPPNFDNSILAEELFAKALQVLKLLY